MVLLLVLYSLNIFNSFEIKDVVIAFLLMDNSYNNPNMHSNIFYYNIYIYIIIIYRIEILHISVEITKKRIVKY